MGAGADRAFAGAPIHTRPPSRQSCFAGLDHTVDPNEPMPPTGLSQAEANRRLQTEGPNELSPPTRRTPLHIALEVAREPMFQLLLAAGGLYLLLGDRAEAGMLLAFVALTAGITVVQEQRTEHALEALRDLTQAGEAGET